MLSSTHQSKDVLPSKLILDIIPSFWLLRESSLCYPVKSSIDHYHFHLIAMVSASKLSAQTTKTSCSVAQESTLIGKPMPARPFQFARRPPRCPRPNGWVPFIRVHLGQRAVRPARGRSQNTQHQTRQKRRTTDAGPRTTAPRKTSIPTTTEQLQLLGRRPHGRLLLFGDLAAS